MGEELLEMFTGGFVKSLAGSAFNLLCRESRMLADLPDLMRKIEGELNMVNSVTETATEEVNSGRPVRAWWAMVLNASYKAEDVVDQFHRYSYRPSLASGIRKAMFSVLEMNRITSRAQLVLNMFQDAHEYRKTYKIQLKLSSASASRSGYPQPQSFSFPPIYGDRPFVGRDGERNELVEVLKGGESRRVVVIVNGMFGMGKTDLVRRVYIQVKPAFRFSVWLTVHPFYSAWDLHNDLYKKMNMGSSPKDNDDTIRERVTRQLKRKKYLIVFDNMCFSPAWQDLVHSLPANNAGSRIIFTSRDQGIDVSLVEIVRVFTLRSLSLSHAWDLFVQVAFPRKTCPHDLENSARLIVTKCEGLPLAVVTLAHLIRNLEAQTPEVFDNVQSEFGSYITNHESCENLKRAFLLIIKELPYHLQRCLMYLSTFPENFVIKKKKLIMLLIGEGLVSTGQFGLTLEEQANKYLENLEKKHLIEILDQRTYQVKIMVREFALYLAKEVNFLAVHDGKTKDPCCHARRLSISSQSPSLKCKGLSHLHSILYFDSDKSSVLVGEPIFSLEKIWSHAKFLRVLHLEDLKLKECPKKLNKLFNLKYLSLRNTYIKNVNGLQKLPDLQILDLRGTYIEQIRLALVCLQNLRHLYLGCSSSISSSGCVVSHGIPPPQGVSKLKNLQTLEHIKADEMFITDLGKLVQLKRLSITDVREAYAEKLLGSLNKMITLTHLSITAAPGQSLVLENASCFPPPSIKSLKLTGPIIHGNLPTWITSLKRLAHLRLRSSKLIDDPFQALQVLSNLEQIVLRNAYMGKEFIFPTESLHKVRMIDLWDLPNLERILIEPGTYKAELHLRNCKKFKVVMPKS